MSARSLQNQNVQCFFLGLNLGGRYFNDRRGRKNEGDPEEPEKLGNKELGGKEEGRNKNDEGSKNDPRSPLADDEEV